MATASTLSIALAKDSLLAHILTSPVLVRGGIGIFTLRRARQVSVEPCRQGIK
jgi:hypothetical protein